LKPWEPGGNEYFVELTGPIDDRWVESYILIRRRSARFSRFHLNRARNRVSFACRVSDESAELTQILESLQLLVDHTNRRTGMMAPRPENTGASDEEGIVNTESVAVEADTRTSGEETEKVLTDRFREAFDYSTQVLGRRPREGTAIPYLAHLMGTSALVIEDGGNEDEAISALLAFDEADVGDRELLLADIRARFGEVVGLIVEGVQEANRALKPERMASVEEYADYLRHAMPAARRLFCATMLNSVRSLLALFRRMTDLQRQGFRGQNGAALRYYRTLVQAFLEVGPTGHLVDELDSGVLEMELGVAPVSAGREIPPGSETQRLTDEFAERLDERLGGRSPQGR
jgi:hypothetical protein